MRGLPCPAASLLALALGSAAGCFHEDFLLGAYCVRDDDCSADQCCNGRRCRPLGVCNRGVDDMTPPLTDAYTSCALDSQCQALGFPFCLRVEDAESGFCTDLCAGDPNLRCELHPSALDPNPRTCIDVDEQSFCAIPCDGDIACPQTMQCHSGVCVPQ